MLLRTSSKAISEYLVTGKLPFKIKDETPVLSPVTKFFTHTGDKDYHFSCTYIAT
jgi:hypothetical protein